MAPKVFKAPKILKKRAGSALHPNSKAQRTGEQPSSDADDAAEASLDSDSERMCEELLKQIREDFQLTEAQIQALNSRNADDGTLSMTELVRIQSTFIGSNKRLIVF